MHRNQRRHSKLFIEEISFTIALIITIFHLFSLDVRRCRLSRFYSPTTTSLHNVNANKAIAQQNTHFLVVAPNLAQLPHLILQKWTPKIHLFSTSIKRHSLFTPDPLIFRSVTTKSENYYATRHSHILLLLFIFLPNKLHPNFCFFWSFAAE